MNIQTPTSSITPLFYDKEEFRTLYGIEAFLAYLQENGIEIQSKKIIKNGVQRTYSGKELATFWEGFMNVFLESREINIAQVISNYKRGNTTYPKQEMYRTLRSIGMQYASLSDVSMEALVLGIAFLFGDSMDISDSLIHTFHIQDEVSDILSAKKSA